MDVDLSRATVEELAQIQNEVLRNIAFKVAKLGGGLASGHDSHGSSHSKNSIVARPDILGRPDVSASGPSVLAR